MDDPTTALNYTQPPWAIVVTQNHDRMAEVLQPYAVKGLQLTHIYNVTTLVEAFSTIAFGFPVDTPWCIADADVNQHAVKFMRDRFGPEQPVYKALDVKIDGIAVRKPPVMTP